MNNDQSLMDAMLDAALSHPLPCTKGTKPISNAEFVLHPDTFQKLRAQTSNDQSLLLYPGPKGMEFLNFPVRVDQHQENWILCEAEH